MEKHCIILNEIDLITWYDTVYSFKQIRYKPILTGFVFDNSLFFPPAVCPLYTKLG